jgi:hypothetical protein
MFNKKKKGTTTMKTYQKPNTEIVMVEVQQSLMAVSGDKTVNSVSVATEDYNGGAILSRQSSVWGDDEEEY